MIYCQLDPKEQFSVKYASKSNIFAQENEFVYVCKRVTIFLGLNVLATSRHPKQK